MCFAGGQCIFSEAFSRLVVCASCLKVLDRYAVVGYEEDVGKRSYSVDNLNTNT